MDAGAKDLIDLVGGGIAFGLLLGTGIAFVRTRLALRKLRATIMGDGQGSPAPTPEELAPYHRQVGKLEARTRNLAMLASVAIGGLAVVGLRRLMGDEEHGEKHDEEHDEEHDERHRPRVEAPSPARSRDGPSTVADAAPYREPAWARATEAGVWQPGTWSGTVLHEFPGSRSLCQQNCELRLHECVAASHDGTNCVLFRRVERLLKDSSKGKSASPKQSWRPPPPR